MRTIEQRGHERDYWMNFFKETIPLNDRQPYYDKINNFLIEQGYKK